MDSKSDTEKALTQLKQQQQVIAEIHDLLQLGLFVGQNSQKVLMGSAYMKGVHDQISAEIKRLEEPTFTEQLKETIASENKCDSTTSTATNA